MSDKLEFEQFGLERAAFEVKYAPSYLHWDQAGSTWTEVLALYPDFQLNQAEPGKTVFTSGNRYQCSLSVEAATVQASFPDRDEFKGFAELAERFSSLIFRSLRITEVLRAGLRLIYFRDLKSKEESANALLATGLVRQGNTSDFGIEGPLIFPKYSVRFEGKSLGITIRVDAAERTYNYDAAFGLKAFEPGTKRFKGATYSESGIVLDIDLFTRGPLPVGAFPVGDWIIQGSARIKRGATSLLKG